MLHIFCFLAALAFAPNFIYGSYDGSFEAFLEKATQIQSKLYQISAPDLQTYLGCNFEHVPTISAEDLLHMIQQGLGDTLVVNVLPKNLYDDCHIKGSDSLPLKELVHRVMDWPRDRKIIVYCALDICDAGQKAYILLRCMGFTDVTDYEGGIKEWFQLGYPTEGPSTSSYLHAKYAKLPDEIANELSECCSVEIPS